MTQTTTRTAIAKPPAHPPSALGLRELLSPVIGSIAMAFLAGLVSAALGLLPAVGVTVLAERALSSTLTPSAAWPWVAGIAVGLLGGHLIYLLGTGYAHRVELRFRTQLRSRITILLARLPLGWHTEESSGRVRSAITEDTAKVHSLIAHFGSDLGQAIGVPAFGLVYLLTRSWIFTLVLLGWLLVTVAIAGALASRNMKPLTEEFSEAEKQLAAASVELADGITAVKTFGLSGALFRRFSDAMNRYTHSSYTWMRGPGRPMAVLSALTGPGFMLLIIVVSGWFLADRGMIAPVDLLPFLLVGVGLPSGVMNLASMGNSLIEARDAAARIGRLLAEPQLPEPDHPLPIDRDERGGVSLTFEHVSFRYDADGPLVLDDVCLELRPGTVTAVVGPSGSGKSTLVRLAARFWDVTDGSVRLGSTDVRDASSQELLSQLAIVLQEGGLLTDTAAENIRLARPDATDEEVRAAAESARMHERVMALPNSYDTVLGSEGAHLSGGERQCIALARAFLADAPVLLLDEATAQADPHSERQVQQALAALARGRTVLVIAHRLATVVDADSIVVLDGGRVVQQGTHPELLASDGLYRALWEAQQ
ncbi:ABC transporter ATP-binding protein [Actinomyces sp. MRS3W]|uniref:ABC transporter ATP-binding protein n=1 Tax=Actinomyces sp. MRS3W TaxID=2800796 RepID=UPI0028FD0EBE|nr:ABC transporter ATP-binding protein [Actinomyces sp. MRS3W]MDU0349171.1 ABC transporter ATP-binding protein [Actinomyces sp. MRS3W]